MDKRITINLLPQDPIAWIAIAFASVFVALAFNSTDDNYRVEVERSRRIKYLTENGMTNAVLAEIQKDLEASK